MVKVFDRRGEHLTTIDPASIPNDVEEILLSNNNFATLPAATFQRKFALWKCDLSMNCLTDLSFLSHYGGLGYLDLRNNSLLFDELLQISHISIAHLRVDGNEFSNITNSHPLTIPAILERVWVLDGFFISDFTRRRAKEFKETLAFAEAVLACRRVKTTISKHTSVSQAAMAFLGGETFRTRSDGDFSSSQGLALNSCHLQPQIIRLRHLSTLYPPTLPPGHFLDYFSLALAILGLEWMNIPFDLIPRVTAPGYWACNSDSFNNLEQFERLLLLLSLCDKIAPETSIEDELWQALGAVHFIQTGEAPLQGSTPRLLVCAFMERSPDAIDNADRAVYGKLRQDAHFTGTDVDLSEIHREIIAPIPSEAQNCPRRGDIVNVTHPVTGEWVPTTCHLVRDGRVYTRGKRGVVQVPVSALYWDKRGTWREAGSREVPKQRVRARSQIDGAFITISKTQEEEVPVVAETPKPKFGTIEEPVAVSPMTILKTNKKKMLDTKFIDRTIKPVETFRGIGDPGAAKVAVVPRVKPIRRGNRLVQDVVNITQGAYVGGGRHLRRFNVRVENALTHKSQYVWISEDEVSPDDVAMLVQLYRKHIESKMMIIPDM